MGGPIPTAFFCKFDGHPYGVQLSEGKTWMSPMLRGRVKVQELEFSVEARDRHSEHEENWGVF